MVAYKEKAGEVVIIAVRKNLEWQNSKDKSLKDGKL